MIYQGEDATYDNLLEWLVEVDTCETAINWFKENVDPNSTWIDAVSRYADETKFGNQNHHVAWHIRWHIERKQPSHLRKLWFDRADRITPSYASMLYIDFFDELTDWEKEQLYKQFVGKLPTVERKLNSEGKYCGS